MARRKQKCVNVDWPTKKQDIEDALALMEDYRICDDDRTAIYYPEWYVAIVDYFSDKYPSGDHYAEEVIAKVTRSFARRGIRHDLYDPSEEAA